jgi:hypothetical protein
VVLAFRGPPLSVSWAAIGLRAAALQRATGLPAVRWVRALRTDSGAAACSV